MKRKLIIHLGTHKTGTSSLQKLTSQFEEELSQEGIKVIDHLEIPRRNEFSRALTFDDSLIKGLNDFLIKETSTLEEKYLLIWEGFSGDPRQKYKNRNIVQEMLFQALPEGIDIELIVFFRRQDQFIQSIFTQIKHEKEFEFGKEFLNPYFYEGFDWNSYINNLITIFKGSSFHIYPYEKSFLDQYPLHKILGDLLNSDTLTSIQNMQPVNVGMNAGALKLFEKIAPKLNKQESKYLRKVLQANYNKGLLNNYNYLSNTEQNEWINHYEESNQKLAEKYWNGILHFENNQKKVNTQAEAIEEVEDELLIHLIKEIEKYRSERRLTTFQKVKQRVKSFIS